MRRRSWALFFLAMLILVVFVSQTISFGITSPAVKLVQLGEDCLIKEGQCLSWKVDNQLRFRISIQNLSARKNGKTKFEARFVSDKPTGILCDEIEENRESNAATFVLSFAGTGLDLLPKYQDIVFEATDSKIKELTQNSRTIRLAFSIPDSWRPDKVKNRQFYSPADSRRCLIEDSEKRRIVYDTVLAQEIAGSTVRFRLIPGRQTPDGSVNTFYIMESLVTNALFEAFARDTSAVDLENADLRRRERVKLVENPLTAGDPVTDVTALSAQQFARWLVGECGNLPTCLEWDSSFGYYDYRNAVDARFKNKKAIPADWEIETTLRGLEVKSRIGTGPTKCWFLESDGKERRECSPYGCYFDKRLKKNDKNFDERKRPTEMTASLLENWLKSSRNLRELCPTGDANRTLSSLEGYLVRLRQFSESSQNELWVRSPEGSVVTEDKLDAQDDLYLVSSGFSKELLLADHIGFRVVLLTQ